jgi:predicted DNA-binding antitoxin AbrB/MazE fold protein
MSFDAIYENGVLRPLNPVDIPDKARVHIPDIQIVDAPVQTDRPLLRLAEILGSLPDDPTTPPDFSYQHDHYLYGTPKKP